MICNICGYVFVFVGIVVGLKYQSTLAQSVLTDSVGENYRSTPSLYLAYEHDYDAFRTEYELLHDVLENTDVLW